MWVHIQVVLRKAIFVVRRAGWRLIRFTSKSDRLFSFRLRSGGRFDYPLDSAIGKCMFAGAFEPAEVRFVQQHLQPGDIVLDVGANAGLYTIIAARAVGPTGHVYAFEPGDRALSLLRNNIEINGLTNVTVVEAAVSNRTGRAQFAVAEDTALSSLAAIDRADQSIAAWRTVDTIRLDDAIQRFGITKVDFLKVDVEGAEKLVLEGASDLLKQSGTRFTIMFEAFNTNACAFGYTAAELLRMVEACGFTLHGFDRSRRLWPVNRLSSGIGTGIYNFVAFKD